MNTSLVILKPDSVLRGLTGQITTRFESMWLTLTWSKLTVLSEDLLKSHYAHLVDKPFFPEIVSFMTAAPVVIQAWTGVEAVKKVRKAVWVTNALEAEPGTVRGDFALNIWANLIHASENEEEAVAELWRFFDSSELFDYQRFGSDMINWR
jgi:nucleoside-diphosphate kinase